MFFLHAFGKLLFLAFLGCMAVVLIGPVLATLLGTVLPFALIGGLAWLVVRGARAALRGYHRRAEEPRGDIARGRARRIAWERVQAVGLRVNRVRERVRNFGRLVGHLVREGLTGTLVGVLLGVLAGWQAGTYEDYIPYGAVLGGLLGLIVGVSRAESARQVPSTS